MISDLIGTSHDCRTQLCLKLIGFVFRRRTSVTTSLHAASDTQLAVFKLVARTMLLLLFLVIEHNYLYMDLIVIGFIIMGLVLWRRKIDNDIFKTCIQYFVESFFFQLCHYLFLYPLVLIHQQHQVSLYLALYQQILFLLD
jgi:hypothetical protein